MALQPQLQSQMSSLRRSQLVLVALGALLARWRKRHQLGAGASAFIQAYAPLVLSILAAQTREHSTGVRDTYPNAGGSSEASAGYV